MKRIISILLIFLIALNSILFGIVSILVKEKLKNDFLTYLKYKDDDSTVTKISSDDISSNPNITIMDNEELMIGDEYFDIYKTEIINGKTIYYCIGDDNEEHLQKTLNIFLSFSLKNFSSKTIRTYLKTINIKCIPLTVQYKSILPGLNTDFFSSMYNLQKVIVKTPTPPPEKIFS